MGFVTQLFIKPAKPPLVQFPGGSFTINREGRVSISTLPQSFPPAHIQAIRDYVLAGFRSADRAQIQLDELFIQYAALKVVARQLRGGAIVFLMPRT